MTLTTLTSKVYFYTKSNSTSFPTADVNQAINNAMERVVSLIMGSDSRWQFDDANQTDLPIAITGLVANQKDYSLSTSQLSLDRVEILTPSSVWNLIAPIDQHDVRGLSLSSYMGSAGIPLQYDKVANSVFLYPTPNYTQSASLKLYFTRGPVALASGSDVPGFNSLFHILLALWPSYDYAVANGLANANQLFVEIERAEKSLIDFYGQRSRDERPRMNVSTNPFGNTQGSISGILTSRYSDTNK